MNLSTQLIYDYNMSNSNNNTTLVRPLDTLQGTKQKYQGTERNREKKMVM